MTTVQICDTIRDGSQTVGLNVKAHEKLRVAQAMGKLAISEIFEELAWRNSNDEDVKVYEELPLYDLGNVTPVAFGSTRKVGVNAAEDATITSIIETIKYGIRHAAVFGKCDTLHVTEVLNTTLEDNRDNVVPDSIKTLRAAGLSVFFDAEHYFDGFRRNSDYALSVVTSAARAGAETIVLCDTNGRNTYFGIGEIVRKTKQHLADQGLNVGLGIHTHNDGDLAVANTLEAILNGAVQVQGCIIPIGERAGNANLASVISWMNYGRNDTYFLRRMQEAGMEWPNLHFLALKEVSDFVYMVTGVPPNPSQPFVGRNVGLHTAGVHQDAERKRKGLYTAFDLSEIGNTPGQTVLGLQSGTAHIATIVERFLGYSVPKKDPRILEILKQVKTMSRMGYQIGLLDAEQELLVNLNYGWKPPFSINRWKADSQGQGQVHGSSAELELQVNGDTVKASKNVKQNGPVDAMYMALLDGLETLHPEARNIKVVGFNVSLAEYDGAASSVRVFFEFGTPEMRWACVGVSNNILKAAQEALWKGVNYYFLKAHKPQG